MMASAGVTALLKKMDYKVRIQMRQEKFRHKNSRQDVVIAIDGSLFRFHPHFKNVMQSRISQLMGINFKFDLLLSEVSSQFVFLPHLFGILKLPLIFTDHALLVK